MQGGGSKSLISHSRVGGFRLQNEKIYINLTLPKGQPTYKSTRFESHPKWRGISRHRLGIFGDVVTKSFDSGTFFNRITYALRQLTKQTKR